MSQLNYTTYVTQLANFFPISSADGNFLTFVPGNIEYAEQRIYRELDLLEVQQTDATTACSSGNRNFTLPTSVGTFITVDQINLITPTGTLSSAGSRYPLNPVSPEYIDLTWPSNSFSTGQPKYFGRRNNTLVVLGPSPDSPYYLEVIGVQRPVALSSGNSSTPLTQYVPDLFMAACLVHAYGYMKDLGGTTDNPQGAISWEAQFNILMKSASVEQARAKFHAEGWTSESPSPLASPPRV